MINELENRIKNVKIQFIEYSPSDKSRINRPAIIFNSN